MLVDYIHYSAEFSDWALDDCTNEEKYSLVWLIQNLINWNGIVLVITRLELWTKEDAPCVLELV